MQSVTLKSALITGASSGIGRAVAMALAARGWKLALCGRDIQRLEDAATTCRNAGAAYVLADSFDITSQKAVEDFVGRAHIEIGGLQVVVHAAGIGLIRPAAETTDAEFTRVTNTNLRGTFLLTQATYKVFAEQKHGLFITFPGILGKAVMRNAAAYSASKFGVVGLLRSMAIEHARLGIRYSLFYLGGVDSPFWDHVDMNPQRDKMIPLDVVKDAVLSAIDLPPHLVPSEVTIQPDSHQLV